MAQLLNTQLVWHWSLEPSLCPLEDAHLSRDVGAVVTPSRSIAIAPCLII